MSALVDRLHALLNRFASIGKADVEEVVVAAESHLMPLFDNLRDELGADIKQLIQEARVDEAKLVAAIAAEVDKLLHPAEPPAPPAPQG